MPYEHKDMTGSFWQNDKKTEAKHPDFKGQIKINGVLWDIAGWHSDKIERLISLKISPPRQQQSQGGYQGEQQHATRPAPQQQPTNTTRARPQSNRPVDSGMRTSAAQEMLGEPEGVRDEDIPF